MRAQDPERPEAFLKTSSKAFRKATARQCGGQLSCSRTEPLHDAEADVEGHVRAMPHGQPLSAVLAVS